MAEIAVKGLPSRFARLGRAMQFTLMYGSFAVGCCVLAATIPWVRAKTPDPAERVRVMRVLAHRFARAFFAASSKLGLTHISVAGARPDKPGLLVANHPSLVDAILLISELPDVCCVIKKELLRFKVLAALARQLGYISNVDPEEMLKEIVERLVRGERVLLFPEATRTRPGGKCELRHSAAETALRSKRPIFPVFVYFSGGYLSKSEPWYHFPEERLEYSLHFADPIEATPRGGSRRTARRRLTAELQSLYRDAQL